jgi:ribosomal protein S18 acetylase RimI-like enzyme
MAALFEPTPPPAPRTRDLRAFSASHLHTLLAEETSEWRNVLDWDFSRSADLVRRFVDLGALNGAAIIEDRVISGYCYYVFEEHKGLVGDLFVTRSSRARDRELILLQTAVREMMAAPFISRIESQLMLAQEYPAHRLPYSQYASVFERNFMLADISRVRDLRLRNLGNLVRIDSWADYYMEAAALLIEEAYRGHVDSSINDQYRSVEGARRFLYNIVNYPGCGSFCAPASLIAVSSAGVLAGLTLASIVNDHTGHITQICVSPSHRGTGLGYELLRRSLLRLLQAGCRRVSLTVTSSNTGAVSLYERMGFRTVRNFHAHVWEGW